MDVSTFLILPVSAIVAFATLIGAAIAKRDAPRLIWPWAFSSLVTALVFLKPPQGSAMGLWFFALFALAVPAAFGTVIGGWAARAINARRRT